MPRGGTLRLGIVEPGEVTGAGHHCDLGPRQPAGQVMGEPFAADRIVGGGDDKGRRLHGAEGVVAEVQAPVEPLAPRTAADDDHRVVPHGVGRTLPGANPVQHRLRDRSRSQ